MKPSPTLLGGPTTPEEEQRHARAKQASDAARSLLQLVLDSYCAGELSFEDAVRWCSGAVSVPDITLGQKMLGAAVQALLAASPDPKRTAGRRPRPRLLNQLCHDLVELVRQREGLPITKVAKGATAYERAVEILKLRGTNHLTPAAVRKARDAWLRDPGID